MTLLGVPSLLCTVISSFLCGRFITVVVDSYCCSWQLLFTPKYMHSFVSRDCPATRSHSNVSLWSSCKKLFYSLLCQLFYSALLNIIQYIVKFCTTQKTGCSKMLNLSSCTFSDRLKKNLKVLLMPNGDPANNSTESSIRQLPVLR